MLIAALPPHSSGLAFTEDVHVNATAFSTGITGEERSPQQHGEEEGGEFEFHVFICNVFESTLN